MPKAKIEKPVKKIVGLSIPVYDLSGKEAGEMELTKEIFGVEINKSLLAQAIRVYLSNITGHFGNTKTRSEVKGSTRKIYRQKGTGGARHGAKSAPIFVHGGIALGPKFRKVILELPKKMKKAALLSALSSKMGAKEIIGIKGLEKTTGKTSEIRDFLKKTGKKKALLILNSKDENTSRATRNLTGIDVLAVDQINVLEVIKHETLIFTKEAVEKLESIMKNKKEIVE